MHPLVSDLSELKTSELENKINDLTKKYFMTSNVQLKSQISAMLETYQETLTSRRNAEYQKMMDERKKDLDNLIKLD